MSNVSGVEWGDGRLRLLNAALKLFAERGFESVTVRDIAAASQMSVGLINHHFGSKLGLRAAVDDHFMQQFEEALTFEPKARDVDRVTNENYALTVDEWIGRHQASWPETLNYFRRALLEESEWGLTLFQRFYGVVQQWVTRLDAQGRIGPDVDRLWLPFLVMYLQLGTTLLDPYITQTLGSSGFSDDLWRRRHRAYMDLVTRGVAPRKATPPE